MSKTPTLDFQVKSCLDAINRIGQSKFAEQQQARAQGRVDPVSGTAKVTYIHGKSTYHKCFEIGKEFARWLQQKYGLTDINKQRDLLTGRGPEFVRDKLAAIAKAKDAKCLPTKDSAWTERTLISSLRIFERAYNVRFSQNIRIVPEGYRSQHVRHLDARQPNRAGRYSNAAAIVKAALARNETAGRVLEAQHVLGLRIGDALRLHVGEANLRKLDHDHIRTVTSKDGTRQTSLVVIPRGTWVITVTGKGGYQRLVPIPTEYLRTFQSLIAGKSAAERVFKVSESAVRRALGSALEKLKVASKGTHGLRKAFAFETYRRLRLQGHTNFEARILVSELLGHHRVSVTYFYITTDDAATVEAELALPGQNGA